MSSTTFGAASRWYLMASLTDKAGFLIAANFVKYGVGFVMPMMLVRVLSKADYGTYQQLQLIGSVATGLLVLGLPNSIYYFYQRDGGRGRAALIQQTLALLLISGALAAVALAVSAPHFAVWMNNPALANFLPIFAISIGLGIAAEHFVHFMISQDHYATAVLFETGETVVRVGVLVLPVLAGYGLPGLLWAIVGLMLGRFALRQVMLLRGIDWQVRPAPGTLFMRQQLAYSLPLCFTSVVGLIGGALDRMIIAANFTPIEYAIYAVGALEIPLDSIFQVAVANVLRAALPALVRDANYAEIARLVRESTRKLSIVILPAFAFLFAYADEFISLLFTKAYSESVSVFRVYLWLVPMHMFILSPIPQAFGRTKINFYLVSFDTVLHVAMSFLFLRWFGYLGPAISSIVATYILAFMYFVVAMRLVRVSPLALLPVQGFARVGSACIVALLVSRQVFAAGAAEGLFLLAMAGALFSVVFVAAAILLRVFTEQDRQLAARWAGRLGLVRR